MCASLVLRLVTIVSLLGAGVHVYTLVSNAKNNDFSESVLFCHH